MLYAINRYVSEYTHQHTAILPIYREALAYNREVYRVNLSFMASQKYIHLQQQTAKLKVSLRAPIVHLDRSLVRASSVLVLWRA